MSMKCPNCGREAHSRSTRYITETTKERYNQCQNLECSTVFVTHETVARIVVRPVKEAV